MATETIAHSSLDVPTIQPELPVASHSSPAYPDPEWSSAILNYYKDADHPPPDTINSSLTEHEMRIIRRGEDSPHIAKTPVRIRNMRGHESEYKIDTHGFTIGHIECDLDEWRDEEVLKAAYYPKITELLKRELGAKYVFQYEYHVRTSSLEEALEADSNGAVDINGPVRRVHIDESAKSAENEFRYYMRPDEPGNEHLKDRPFAIFNVWKGIKTVRKDPLCLCDHRTIRDEDLQLGKVTVAIVGEIENYSLRGPAVQGAHSFSYLREQKPEEVYIFRIFDSRLDQSPNGADKRSHGAAHSSFIDPGTENEAPRESIEVRNFCVF